MKLKITSTIRTNNFNDLEMMNKIGSLWSQNKDIVKEKFQSNQSIFVVYHDYDSNYRGDYSVSLCIISQEKYDFDTSKFKWSKYPVDTAQETGVVDAWKQIWENEDKNVLKRVYSFDFEQYNPDGSICIMVAIVN